MVQIKSITLGGIEKALRGVVRAMWTVERDLAVSIGCLIPLFTFYNSVLPVCIGQLDGSKAHSTEIEC